MTAYVGPPLTTIDQGSPLTQPVMVAFRDDPIAISEGSPGSPVARTGWHPYDMLNVGDGADGEIYDFAVDGAVSSIETPAFADGYEYILYINGLTPAGATDTMTIHGYRETDAAYGIYDTSATMGSNTHYGNCQFSLPRQLRTSHAADLNLYGITPTNLFSGADACLYDATLQKISKAKITISASTFSAGKAHLYRRREFTTG